MGPETNAAPECRALRRFCLPIRSRNSTQTRPPPGVRYAFAVYRVTGYHRLTIDPTTVSSSGSDASEPAALRREAAGFLPGCRQRAPQRSAPSDLRRENGRRRALIGVMTAITPQPTAKPPRLGRSIRVVRIPHLLRGRGRDILARMSFLNVQDRFRFSPEKMQKVNLFETADLFCDVYSLEPGQGQKPHTHPDATKFYYVLQGQG